MATFTISGYQILSEAAGYVTDIKAAQLQFVSPLGHATLDFSYASDDPKSAEVSLSDYNLIINGLHLNDGTLPERIELFNLTWGMETRTDSSQVINLTYEDGGGWRDCIFAVGRAPLPDLSAVFGHLKVADGTRVHASTCRHAGRLGRWHDPPALSRRGQ